MTTTLQAQQWAGYLYPLVTVCHHRAPPLAYFGVCPSSLVSDSSSLAFGINSGCFKMLVMNKIYI